MNRKILFIIYLAGSLANASVTKVGNGNDGADLENLKIIKEGPILSARDQAVAWLKTLNVQGIAGLGRLIPEVEHSDLMMADKDAHPTGEAPGSIEISADQNLVYARTFAEPYAATRFFPAATKLTKEQLIALHIHEALHRALPENIRENEDIVSHLTMALTSPGANHDRVRQVARLYVRQAPNAEGMAAQSVATKISNQETRILPKTSRSKFAAQFEAYDHGSNERTKFLGYSQGIEFGTSLGGYQ